MTPRPSTAAPRWAAALAVAGALLAGAFSMATWLIGTNGYTSAQGGRILWANGVLAVLAVPVAGWLAYRVARALALRGWAGWLAAGAAAVLAWAGTGAGLFAGGVLVVLALG